jgi:hypothetical protein
LSVNRKIWTTITRQIINGKCKLIHDLILNKYINRKTTTVFIVIIFVLAWNPLIFYLKDAENNTNLETNSTICSGNGNFTSSNNTCICKENYFGTFCSQSLSSRNSFCELSDKSKVVDNCPIPFSKNVSEIKSIFTDEFKIHMIDSLIEMKFLQQKYEDITKKATIHVEELKKNKVRLDFILGEEYK